MTEKFQCKVEKGDAWRMPDDPEAEDLKKVDGYCVLTTTNGYQWSGSTSLTLDELMELYEYIGEVIQREVA